MMRIADGRPQTTETEQPQPSAVSGRHSDSFPSDQYAHRLHVRRAWRPFFRIALRVLADLQVHGLENLPERGPLILAFNHLGHLDPLLLYITMPTPPEIIGLAEAWSLPCVGWFVRQYGGIPVRRDQFDRAVVDQALAILHNGLTLALAPEARFSTTGQLEQGRNGVAYLAMKANAPILPIGISGTELIGRKLRPRISMNYGRVMQLRALPENGVERKLALRDETDRVMRAIAALLPEEYRGIYGG